MNSLLKKSFRILLGRGVISVVTLLFTMFFAYELPKSIFALIALYDTIVSLSKVVTDLGLHNSVIRYAPPLFYSDQRQTAIAEIIFPATVARFFSSVLVSVLFLVGVLWFEPSLQAEFPDLNITYIAWITAFHLLIENCHSISNSIFAVKQLFGTHSVLESSITFLEGLFALIFYLWLGINQYFLGLLVGQLIVLVIRFYYLRNILRWKYFVFVTFERLRSMLVSNFPFYLKRFFRIGFVQGELLVIAAFLPFEQMANYRLAKKSSGFLKQYLSAFVDPLTIKLSKTRDLSIREQYVRTYLKFTIPPPILLACLSPWIMALVGGDKYAGSWPILAVLYISYVFGALSILQLNILTIFGKKTDALLRDSVGGTLGLGATILFVIVFQENGIAWGQLVSNLILAVLGYRLAQKYLKTDTNMI